MDKRLLASVFLALGTSLGAQATVRLPALVGNHMVLQRDVPVPVWGWATAGERVVVRFREHDYPAKPGASGRWQVALPATPAGGPYTLTVKGRKDTQTIEDILVGDVWLASGQSNMELPLRDDLGDPDDIHPANKQDVGYRLALAARQVAYGDQQVVAAGPTFQSMQASGSQLHVKFSSVGTGLVLKSGATTLTGFAVAGADGQFHWAAATLAGPGEVVLRCAAVPTPVAVRYVWANNPQGNLYNREGLPAAPFRTDAPTGSASH